MLTNVAAWRKCGHPRTPENTYRHKKQDGHAETCRTCAVEYHLNWLATNLDEWRATTRRAGRKHRTGWTEDEFRAAFKAQGGLCAICEQPKPLHADHNHRTGAKRALLCFACNSALGQLQEDPGLFLRAAEYLANYASVIKDSRSV